MFQLVDKRRMKTHNPADSTSSPYEPTMGDIVIYRTGRRDESFPAIITRTYPNDTVDLTIFSSTGIRYDMRVPFNAEATVNRASWCWAPERASRRRPIARELDEVKGAVETVQTGGQPA